jgi:RNA polymerase sigma-70 factor (ECF subfamily)
MILVSTKEIMLHHLSSRSSEAPCERPRTQADVALLVVHMDAAYNLARWLMRNETDAEDVAQEAYLRAISHFAGFRGGDADGRAWLLAIVRNRCYDRLRQKGAWAGNTEFDDALHSGSRDIPNPEALLLLSERIELVRRSLADLSEEYREVLVLRELEQMSYREIGNIVGIPLGTVMSRLSRGRQRLQQMLLDYLEREPLEAPIGDVAYRRPSGGGDATTLAPESR